MRRLSEQPSPYSVLLASAVVLIMISPNVVFLLINRSMADRVAEPVELGQGEVLFGLVFTLVLQVVLFVIAMLPLLLRRRLDGRLFGPSRPTGSWIALGLGLAAGVFALFTAYGVNIVLALSIGVEDPVEQQLVRDATSSGASLAVVAVIAVIIAPIVEEIVFRGVLFRALSDRVGLWFGAIVSSLVFAFIHVEIVFSQPLALGGFFAVGVALAFAYHWTGNLLVPILGHAVFNAASLAFAFVLDRLDLDEISTAAETVAATGSMVGSWPGLLGLVAG